MRLHNALIFIVATLIVTSQLASYSYHADIPHTRSYCIFLVCIKALHLAIWLAIICMATSCTFIYIKAVTIPIVIVWSSKALAALLHDSKVILEGCLLYLNFTWGSDLALRGQTAFPIFFIVVETTNKMEIKSNVATRHQLQIRLL